MSLLDILLGQRPPGAQQAIKNNTPGINPEGGDPFAAIRAGTSGAGGSGRTGDILNNPLLLNLMAQSGYSTMPQSPIGAFGRAMLQTQQEERQSERQAGLDDIQRRLIESQIGRNEAAATQGGNPTAENVQSSFRGKNGNLWYLTRGGEVVDTGVEFNKSLRFFENPDSSITGVDPTTGAPVGDVRSPDQAREQVLGGVDLEQEADDRKGSRQDIQTGEATLFEVGGVIDDVNSLLNDVGITTTGPLGAILESVPGSSSKNFAAAKERVVSFLSLEKIAQMKAQSATGATGLGAVNEREFDALSKAIANLDQAQSPGQMRREMSKLLATLTRIQSVALEDIERARRAGSQGASSGFRIVE